MLAGGTVQYGYDAAGRLISVDYGDGRVIRYSYDAAGNLTKRERTGATAAMANASRPGVHFEVNQGQIDKRYGYLARQGQYRMAVAADEATLTAPGGAMRLVWLGGNPEAAGIGEEPLAAATNYLTGNDPRQWRTGIRNYGKVRYQRVYPGVDVVYYGNPRQLEYDVVVKPGADPAAVAFRLEGVSGLQLAPNGDLEGQAGGATLLLRKPVVYQMVAGVRREVDAAYEMRDGRIGFRLGRYDHSAELVIDPVFGDFTMIGGNGDEFPTAAVEDGQGFIYVTGTTSSTDLPGVGRAAQGGNAGATDVFVMKMTHDAKGLVWVTYLGGTAAEAGGGIALDGQGNVTVSGTTASQNFPVTGDALQRSYGGGASDGFVVRLNARGERLLYGSFVGGSGDDGARSVAVDAAGAVYVAGVTGSANFATRPGAVQEKPGGGTDGFVVKLTPGAAVAVYATLLGGSGADGIQQVAVEAGGSVYVAGSTSSANFPTTTGSLAASAAGGMDGFVAKINATGTALTYSTYVGGGGDDQVLGLAVNAGSAYVSGVTTSRNLPMRGSVFNGQYLGGASDGFVLQLTTNGNGVAGGSYLGGNGADSADAVAVRREGTILVAVNGTSFAGEPARMYAFPPDLSMDFGAQSLSPGCGGTDGKFVALTHSAERSLAIGWTRPGTDCRAPQRLDAGKGTGERMAVGDRSAGEGTEVAVASSGSAPGAPPAPLPPVRPTRQYRSSGSAGDPFSTATGEHTDVFDDFRIGGVVPISFRRYYSSVLGDNDVRSGLGTNWAHNFDLAMTVTAGTAVVALEGGVKVTFRLVSGTWQMQGAQRSEYGLVESATEYRLGDAALDRILTFNKKGQLTRVEDRNGNALRVTAGANGPMEVNDGQGRWMKFTYFGGFLTEVRDHTGRGVQFSYRGENLASVTDVYNRVTRYEYGDGGRLTRHLLPAGNAAYVNTYDARGRVTEQADAEGQATKVAYEANGATAVSDPLGAVTRHTHDSNGDLVRVTDATGGVVEMSYDTAHRRTSMKDRLGNTVTLAYHGPTGRVATYTDTLGNRRTTTYTAQTQNGFVFYNATKVERPDGSAVSYTYDERGNPLTVTDRVGKTWRYTYNAQGMPLTLTAPGGGVTKWTYQADGLIAGVTTASGDTTAFTRDSLGRVTKIAYADGSERRLSYDAGDHLAEQVDENGKSVKYTRNQNEQLTSVTDEAGNAQTWAYHPNRLASQVIDRAGNKTAVSYNRNNLMSKMTDPTGGEVEFAYDSLNRMTAVKDTLGTRYQYGYNQEGVPVSVTDGLGRTWKMESDKMGRITRTVSPLGVAESAEYDAFGRTIGTTNGAGEKASFGYDGRGLLTSLSGPGGLKTALEWNEFGSLAGVTDAGGGVWKSKYDEAGRMVESSDPLGRAMSYGYDKRGRMVEVKLPGDLGSTVMGYDPAGRLITTKYSDGEELAFKRDEKGRLVEANGITLSYDANDRIVVSNGLGLERDGLGRVAAVSYGEGKTVRYRYNARGQVTKVIDWVGGETELSYNAAGELSGMKRANGVVMEMGYDGDGRVASIEEKKDGTIGKMSFRYDAAGRVTAEERNLPVAADPKAGTEEYGYDAAGQLNGATYDAAGRMQSDGKRTYRWNVGARMMEFATGESRVGLTYDARGQLIGRSKDGGATGYVVNYGMAQPVIAVEQVEGAAVRYYVHLPNGKLLYSVDAATGARRFHHYDRLGSTMFLTGEDGAVTDSYEYTPYGEAIGHQGTTNNPFTYLGAWGVMQQDEGGLYLMRFRHYDAGTGRFLTRDPQLDPSPRAVNPYQYAMGNPVSYSDPKGLSAAAPKETVCIICEMLIAVFGTPEGLAALKEAKRKKDEEEERERQRQREEEERLQREYAEAMRVYEEEMKVFQKRAVAHSMALAMMASTGYTHVFECDLDLRCVVVPPPTKTTAPAVVAAVPIAPAPAPAISGNPPGVTPNPQALGGISARVISRDGAGLVGQDGAGLVGQDGAGLVGQDGAGLVGQDGAGLVGQDGAGFKQ